MKLVPLKTGRTCQPVDSLVHHRITRIPLPGERKLYNYPVNNYHDRVCDHRSPVSLTIFNCARFSVRIAYLPLPFYFIENLRRFPRTTSTSDKFLLFSLSLSSRYEQENRSNPIRLNSILPTRKKPIIKKICNPSSFHLKRNINDSVSQYRKYTGIE